MKGASITPLNFTKKIAVISDTHRSVNYIRLVLGKIQQRQVDEVYHLGDFYDDAQILIENGFNVTRIPGTWTPYYQNPMIENRPLIEVLGWKFALTHTPDPHRNDLPTDPNPHTIVNDKQCDVLMHGHTHHPRIDRHPNGTILFNPGHLKEGDDRGFPPTYGIIQLTQERLEITIIGLLTDEVWKQELFIKRG